MLGGAVFLHQRFELFAEEPLARLLVVAVAEAVVAVGPAHGGAKPKQLHVVLFQEVCQGLEDPARDLTDGHDELRSLDGRNL